jgi:hypothetical protein
MTNLKKATPSGSNKLSDHHPSGSGNETAFGDFVIKAVGREDPNTASNFLRLLHPESVYENGSTNSTPGGSYNSNDWFEFGPSVGDLEPPDRFTIRVETDPSVGEYAVEQILKGASSTSHSSSLAGAAVKNASLYDQRIHKNAGNYPVALDLEYEVTGFNNVQIGLTFDDGLNLNADNYGTSNLISLSGGLFFRTRDIKGDSPLISKWQVQVTGTSRPGEYEVEFNIPASNFGESGRVYDPSGKIDAQFYVYENPPSNNSPSANDTDPNFSLSSLPLAFGAQETSSVNGAPQLRYWVEIEDQSGNEKDFVEVRLNQNYLTDSFPSSSGVEECYEVDITTSRSPGASGNIYQPPSSAYSDVSC